MSEKKDVYILEKLDGLAAGQAEMNRVLERNTASLESHIRRTEILEEELKPIKRHVALINLLCKVGVALSLAVAGGLRLAHELGLF